MGIGYFYVVISDEQIWSEIVLLDTFIKFIIINFIHMSRLFDE